MTEPEATLSKHYLKIAEKVRTGEYFREARTMYDVTVNDPMSERYIYIFVTFVSMLVLMIAYGAMNALYPLQSTIPLTYLTNDIIEDIPHVQRLQGSKSENSSEALLRFLVKHYIVIREEYNINTFDRDVNGVKSQSSDNVYREFQQFIDPGNPESPIKVYQRHSIRKINILSTRRTDNGMEVLFEALVDSRTDVKKSHWRVNMTFEFSGIELDEKTGTFKPMNFVVTEYHSKRLQDTK